MSARNDSVETDLAGPAIVGGSLGGLSMALGLAAQGISSTVLEKSRGRSQRGVAILVSLAGVARTLSPQAMSIVRTDLGEAAMNQPLLPHSWWRVYSALYRACEAEPLVTLIDGVEVDAVGQGWVRAADRTWTAPAVIGADGYRSVVRRYVNDSLPDATFAGYTCWLGQSDIPPNAKGAFAHGSDFYDSGPYMLAVYPQIDPDGATRKFGWGLWDPVRRGLFEEIGAVSTDGKVLRTPRPDDVPEWVYGEMAEVVGKHWPGQWTEPVAEAFRRRDVLATPIAEYLPERVVNGNVAIIGDAAHVQTPMTGAGFSEAVADAEVLSRMIATAPGYEQALADYEKLRLTDMRRRVSAGMDFSRSFTQ